MDAEGNLSIAAVVDWPRPGRTACQEQTMATLTALSRQGHRITIHMPQGRGDPAIDAAALRRHYGVEGAFEVVQHASRWGGTKAWQNLLWLRQIMRRPQLAEADLVYSRVPVLLFSGWRCPHPFIFDHYRDWAGDMPLLRPLIRKTLNARHCLGMVLHSDYAADAVRGLADDPAKLLVAMNGYEAARFSEPIDRVTARRELGLPLDRKLVVYTGRTNRKKGLDRLLEIADLCPEQLFVLVGHEGQEWIASKVQARQNVMLVGWQEPDALPRWLAAADLLVIPPSLAPLERFGTCVLPLKTFQYLAAARPIMAPRAPDTEGLLVHESNALLVTPDQPQEAASAIATLIENSELSAHLSAGARATAECLTWDARATKIAGFIRTRITKYAC